jgi:sodium/hydrogen antiporter
VADHDADRVSTRPDTLRDAPDPMIAGGVVFAVLLLAFAALSSGLGRLSVTAPLTFVTAGAAISLVAGDPSVETILQIRLVAEVTLALILFHDAAQVSPRLLRGEARPVSRLLLIALPLTVLLGYAGARMAFPEAATMTALLLAAALAPTDAGLGSSIMADPAVPVRVRRLLNFESGLNDGLVTPVVLFAIAAVAGAGGLRPGVSVATAIVELLGGAVVGALVGVMGARLLGWSIRRDLSTPHSRALAVLGLPILAFFLASLVHGQAFIAAFVAGMAFAGSARWVDDEGSVFTLTESLSELAGYLVWLAFGFAATPVMLAHGSWPGLVYALLSLTVFRMVPIVVAMLRSGFRWPTVAFVGWFGPRGLATVVFALIALESLQLTGPGRRVLATVTMAVLLSVVAHGLTAGPLGRRYGDWVRRTRPSAELRQSPEPRGRSLLTDRGRPSPQRGEAVVAATAHAPRIRSEGGATMSLGPIEVVVLGFPGNRFTGEIRPRIVDLVQRDIVTVIDALFITKDEDGTVGYLELEQLVDDPELAALGGLLSSRLDLLAAEDATELATELEPGSSALALVFEHRWMAPVRDAIVDSGGHLLADLHIPADVVERALAAAQ